MPVLEEVLARRLDEVVAAASVAGLPFLTFDDHVKAALDSLPPNLAAALDNVAVVVEDEHPDDPDLYGLYEGTPLPERGDMAGALPDRITIFRLPLEEEFPDPAGARARDPDHRPARARPLLRPRRRPSRRARIRVTTALVIVLWIAFAAGAFAIVAFLLRGPD